MCACSAFQMVSFIELHILHVSVYLCSSASLSSPAATYAKVWRYCKLSGPLNVQFLQCFDFFFSVFLPFLGPPPAVYGGSQARGRIGAVATGLRQSHSNEGPEPCLQPTPQLTAALNP